MSLSARLALALAAVSLVTGAGYLGLRSSSLTGVEDVFVVGLRSDDQNAIRDALRREALGMTTLDVREEALEAAVARFPSVESLRAEADFPHKLTIVVNERLPIAVLRRPSSDGGGTPVAATGVVLADQKGDRLPVVDSPAIPAGGRVEDPQARGALAVLAAAPESIRARIERVSLGKDGYRLDLRRGPDLVVGAARDLEAKWAAAARVLADSEAAGAAYVDVRLPERTVAGGLPVAVATPTPTSTPAPTP